jgi:hypothetical protein
MNSKRYCEQILTLHKMNADRQNGEVNPAVEIFELLLDLCSEFPKMDLALSSSLKAEHHCQVKECYLNAQKIAMFGDYDYYEGYACRIIPTDHAWLVDRDTGLVIDPTWENLEEGEADYFGLQIPIAMASKVWAEEQIATQLLWKFLESKRSET